MQNTSNYQLPTYEATDNANLLDGYNEAMDKIDAQMKANNDATVIAATAASNANQAATSAESKATAAQTSAASAKSAASSAESKASAAQTAAEDAQTAAQSAQSTASSALNRANDAYDKAEEALGTVGIGTEVVCIGDSFTFGGSGVTMHWPEFLTPFTGTHVHTYGENGEGFVDTGVGGATFQTTAATAVSDLSDQKNRVAHVVLYGGLNDFTASVAATTVAAAIKSVYNTLAAGFPNAKVHFMLFNAPRINLDSVAGYPEWATDVCSQISDVPYTNAMFILGGLGSDYFVSDGSHPSNQGQRVIAREVNSVISSGGLSGTVVQRKATVDHGTVIGTWRQDGSTSLAFTLTNVDVTQNAVTTVETLDAKDWAFPTKAGLSNMIMAYQSSGGAGVYPIASVYYNIKSGQLRAISTATDAVSLYCEGNR